MPTQPAAQSRGQWRQARRAKGGHDATLGHRVSGREPLSTGVRGCDQPDDAVLDDPEDDPELLAPDEEPDEEPDEDEPEEPDPEPELSELDEPLEPDEPVDPDEPPEVEEPLEPDDADFFFASRESVR